MKKPNRRRDLGFYILILVVLLSVVYLLVNPGSGSTPELVYSEVIVSLPMKHLCNEECKGICFKCGKNLNEGECDCPKKDIDPRLAPLQAILDRMKAEQQE